MNKVLEIIAKTASGTKKTTSIALPNFDLTREQIETAFKKLIDMKFFITNGGYLVELVEVRYKSVNYEVVA